MLELTTYTELEIAHRLLSSYTGRCRALHGHRYEVEITVTNTDGLNEDNMIVDFKKLKETVKKVLDDHWDHASCFSVNDPLVSTVISDKNADRVHVIDANPTLEWMVRNWADELQNAFDTDIPGLRLVQLKASETARNTVTYRP